MSTSSAAALAARCPSRGNGAVGRETPDIRENEADRRIVPGRNTLHEPHSLRTIPYPGTFPALCSFRSLRLGVKLMAQTELSDRVNHDLQRLIPPDAGLV